eukprot:GHVR01065449.1.p1 GENE.GHVR01065449.1~~GHVR01065449.1.p1  ORF type:complete len:100 (-),score=17.57 GHVR01065449.1:447-746(-)
MRVYLQVQQWTGQGNHHAAEEWGWCIQEYCLSPILADKEAAPPELLEVVRCNCKRDCHTRKCSCRKNGINCSTACRQYRGLCSKAEIVHDDDNDEICDD